MLWAYADNHETTADTTGYHTRVDDRGTAYYVEVRCCSANSWSRDGKQRGCSDAEVQVTFVADTHIRYGQRQRETCRYEVVVIVTSIWSQCGGSAYRCVRGRIDPVSAKIYR